jgi:aryl-alcohol dehydrogenase-like predicted oxidoreductase
LTVFIVYIDLAADGFIGCFRIEQVQWSLLDRRPEVTMLEVAAKRNIALLTYGSIGGGLLSDRWLGREQPTSRADLDTASLGMYYRSLQRTFRGWEDFQDLLKALRGAVFFKNTCCFRLAPCFPDNCQDRLGTNST